MLPDGTEWRNGFGDGYLGQPITVHGWVNPPKAPAFHHSMPSTQGDLTEIPYLTWPCGGAFVRRNLHRARATVTSLFRCFFSLPTPPPNPNGQRQTVLLQGKPNMSKSPSKSPSPPPPAASAAVEGDIPIAVDEVCCHARLPTVDWISADI